MVSPVKSASRSPLKETDTNLRQPPGMINGVKHSNVVNTNDMNTLQNGLAMSLHTNKKRSIEKLEQQNAVAPKKKPKIERSRSIEGAVLINKPTILKNVNENKVTPKELLEWQNNWKKIMRRDSRIYFDTTEDKIDNLKNKKNMDKKKELLRRGFLSLGAEITKFFDTSVTIVITTRSTDNINTNTTNNNNNILNDNDILIRAKKNYMKVWGYEKAFRFLTNLDVDFNSLLKNRAPMLTTPSLSNLLQNEKLYGPNDRDPRTKRDDIHYFKYPHIYMYDLWQTWAPIITLEWKPQELSDENKLPYPVLKMGTFGRCPFIGDRYCNENSSKRIMKRYNRDKLNKPYASKLRELYQHCAIPDMYESNVSNDGDIDNVDAELIYLPHTCSDSKQKVDTLCQTQTSKRLKITTISEEDSSNLENEQTVKEIDYSTTKNDGQNNEVSKFENNNDNNDSVQIIQTNSVSLNRNNSNTWKEPPTPCLKHPALVPLTKQETEEFQDDLCTTTKRQSRVPFEIKASGVHQSNDVATSFGNGLGPTRASVMSKNIKTLSRLVDRKLDTSSKKNVSSNIINSLKEDNVQGDNNLKRRLSMPNITDTNNSNLVSSTVNSKRKLVANESTLQGNINQQQQLQQQSQQRVKKPAVKNSGYCENCRVKYESLDDHIISEKHSSFANNDLNFEAIDCLIGKLRFQF